MTDGFAINLHKALVPPVVLVLMWWFQNGSVEMFIYLALHGTYAGLWLLKQALYPDKRFDVTRPIWISLLFVFLPLGGYYLAPYLLASRHVTLPAPAITAIIVIYVLGIFLHFVSDAQKYFTLRFGPRLLTDGLFSRTRNPNYLGEIMIYTAFSALAAHWAPFVVVGLWVVFFFIPSMRAKDESLSRYPEFAAYKTRTFALLPKLW